MARQYKGTVRIEFRITEEQAKLLRDREGYTPHKRGVSSGDSHECKKIVMEALGVDLKDPHAEQSKKFADKS